MQGVMRVNGRIATVRLRVSLRDLPAEASVTITDLMLQPGGGISGWMPHITELPWSAGVSA